MFGNTHNGGTCAITLTHSHMLKEQGIARRYFRNSIEAAYTSG